MKVKVQTKINFNINKVDKQSVNDLIFFSVIRKVLRAATAKVKRAFTKGVDVRGDKYEKLSKRYETFKNEVAPGKPIMVGATEKLARSIGFSTNQQNMSGTLGSSSTNPEYEDHLNGNEARKIKVRKWFFTETEERDMFDTEDMLQKEYHEAIEDFSNKLVAEMRTNFRKLGKDITIK